MNSYSNGCTSKSRPRTLAVLAAGAALCVSVGATAGAAPANQLPDPAPSLIRADVVPEPGPPNYPEYDPRYEVEPLTAPSSDGTASQWLPAGATGVVVIGIAGGVLWLNRRRIG